MKKIFDIFEIEYTNIDLEYIDELINYLKNNYKRIMVFFGIKTFKEKIKIKIWNNVEEYRNYFNTIYKKYGYNKTVPSWEMARVFTDTSPKIFLISYKESLKCKGHQKDDLNKYLKVILHEFVHTCQFEFNNHNESLTWLNEALATTLSHQYDNYPLTLDVSLDSIINGQASYINYYTMGKYLINNYSKEYILELAKNRELLTKDTSKIYEETLLYINNRKISDINGKTNKIN